MKLVEFSVTNYRSITKAHKIELKNLTVLVGKNNEGKSNLLTALNVAMNAMISHGRDIRGESSFSRQATQFLWQRDFPIQYQERKSGLDSIFKLNFRLEGNELNEFHTQTGIRGNEDIPISIKIGKDNTPKIEVPKKGSSSYNKKSKQITKFISQRISFNYIPAIRTETMALRVLQNVIWSELESLNENPEYIKAQQKVNELQQKIFNQIAEQLLDPLKMFLPALQNVSICKRTESKVVPYMRDDIDVIIDDGLATSINNKGDGIKSLLTLAILKDKRYTNGASIIAIEEPESHLHSGAIHGLVEVINRMSQNNQVIITTHNPLFVQQNRLNANILVDGGTARPAKSIAEIRNILGVLPSDNLRNARFVFLVEGEDDKIILSKILPVYSEKIKKALEQNLLVIKTLGGAGNLSHDLADLKNCMCQYVVLLDNDEAGIAASEKAIRDGLIEEGKIKFTICNGVPNAELEDCLRREVYENKIKEEFNVILNVSTFRGNEKWSNRMKSTFSSQGSKWTDLTEKKVKLMVAESVPDNISDLENVVVMQKAGFLEGVVTALEEMIKEEH